jgi:hypothetical protein
MTSLDTEIPCWDKFQQIYAPTLRKGDLYSHTLKCWLLLKDKVDPNLASRQKSLGTWDFG